MSYRNLAAQTLTKFANYPALMTVSFGRWPSTVRMITELAQQKGVWISNSTEFMLPVVDISGNAGTYDLVALSWKDLGVRNRTSDIDRREYPINRGRELGFEICSAAMGTEALAHILMMSGWQWPDVSHFCMAMDPVEYTVPKVQNMDAGTFSDRLEIEHEDESPEYEKKLGQCFAESWDSVRWVYLRPKT